MPSDADRIMVGHGELLSFEHCSSFILIPNLLRSNCGYPVYLLVQWHSALFQNGKNSEHSCLAGATDA